MKQMAGQAASTAVGVAGAHVMMDAFRGSGSSSSEPQEQQQMAYSQDNGAYGDNQQNPCSYELQSFMDCINQNAGDLNVCSQFNESLKDCKFQYNIM